MRKIKTTKRQRKAVKGLNSACFHSLNRGSEILISGVEYLGQTPVFKDLNANAAGLLPNFVKVQKGIPFVRVAG